MNLKRILAISCLILVTGCGMDQSFIVNNKVSPVTVANSKPVLNQARPFFFGGLFQSDEIDAAAVCHGSDKILKVERKETAGNWLAGIATVGIYTPRNVKVFCTE